MFLRYQKSHLRHVFTHQPAPAPQCKQDRQLLSGKRHYYYCRSDQYKWPCKNILEYHVSAINFLSPNSSLPHISLNKGYPASGRIASAFPSFHYKSKETGNFLQLVWPRMCWSTLYFSLLNFGGEGGGGGGRGKKFFFFFSWPSLGHDSHHSKTHIFMFA